MMATGILVAFCVAGAAGLWLPRLTRWLSVQAWVFADRMRWYGVRLEADRVYRILLAATTATGVMVWALSGSMFLALLAAGLTCVAPGWIISGMQAYRRRRFAAQFVDVLLLMANSLRAGFNLSQTFEIVANEMPSPTRNEFALVNLDRGLGASMQQALESLARRMNYESVNVFTTAVLVTMQTGGDIARMLDALVGTIRDRERVEDRIRTMTSSGRMQGNIVAALPAFLFAGVYVFHPATVARLLGHPLGVALIVIGVSLNLAGLVVIRKLSAVKV